MALTFPYERTTVTHTAEDINLWTPVTLANDESVTADLRGKSFLVSPAFGVQGRERHHHSVEIVVEGQSDKTIDVHMGFAPVDTQLDRVYSTYYYTTNFKNLTLGTTNKDYESRYGNRAINWWLVEVTPGITIKSIKHTYWQAPTYTNWMHGPTQTIEFNGGRMHYAVSLPPNYNSEESTKYPVMFTCGGSGELGDDKRFLTQIVPSAIITKNYRHYHDFPCIYVAVQIPFPDNFTGYPAPDTAYPYHSGWNRYYDSRSPGMDGMRILLQQMIDSPDYQVDEDRIYISGMSGGGLLSFEALKGMRDILAAAAPISAWSIGGAYQNIETHYHWNEPYEGGDTIKDRLRKEVLRGKHIPTLVGVGSNDNMKYGSRVFKDMADEVGATCNYVEIPNGSHGGTVKQVWSKTENLEWIFSHTKAKDIPDDPFPNPNNLYAECYKPAFDLELAAKGVPENIVTVIDYAYEQLEVMSTGDLDMDGDVDNADIGAVVGNFTGSKRLSSSSGGYNFDPIQSELITYGVSSTTLDCYAGVFYNAERAALGDLDGDGDVDNADVGKIVGNYTGSKKK